MKGGLREKRGGGKAVLTKQTGFRTSSTQKERDERRSQLSVKNKERKSKEKRCSGVRIYRRGGYRGRRKRDGFDENMDNPLERKEIERERK